MPKVHNPQDQDLVTIVDGLNGVTTEGASTNTLPETDPALVDVLSEEQTPVEAMTEDGTDGGWADVLALAVEGDHTLGEGFAVNALHPDPSLVDPDTDQDFVQLIAAPPSVTPPATEDNNPHWRTTWPTNHLRMIARLHPRATQAPALDGVTRVRMTADLIAEDMTAPASTPIYILPAAPGLTFALDAARAAQRQKKRAEPLLVEMHGVVRELVDRDGRYNPPRFPKVTALEMRRLDLAPEGAEHGGWWEGRGTVEDIRPYTVGGTAYHRATLLVVSHTARQHGVRLNHVRVDVLVAPDHPHAARVRVGQRLLVAAEVVAQTIRLAMDHPDLANVADDDKLRLAIVRQALLTLTMAEFPDTEAEKEYATWAERQQGATLLGAARPPRKTRRRPSLAAQP